MVELKRDCSVRKLDYSSIVLRESKPRQVDKKSGFPEEVEAVWGIQERNRNLEFSRRRKGQFFFSLHCFLRII